MTEAADTGHGGAGVSPAAVQSLPPLTVPEAIAGPIDWLSPIPVEPLWTHFDAAVATFGSRPCLEFLGRHYRYADVGQMVNAAAKGLQQIGVGPGTKVGLCLPNCPYYVVFYFAVLKAGATVVNYNPLYPERELQHLIEDSETDLMVTLDLALIYPRVAAMLDKTRLKRIIVGRMADVLPPLKGLLFPWLRRADIAAVPDDERHVWVRNLLDNDGRYQPVTVDPRRDIAVLQYTGGTTGVPKGAMLTHANLTANLHQVRRWFAMARPGEERMLGMLPFFHVFAMTIAMNLGLAIGAEIILVPRFDLAQLLDTIRRLRPTLFPGVPTLYKAISGAPNLNPEHLSSIRLCLSGGAPLPLEVKSEFERLSGCTLVEGYGLSESSPVAACNPLQGISKTGSIGLPMPHTRIVLRALDGSGAPVPLGEKGEVCIIGPQVMAGYWKRPADTAAVLENGVLRTGDVGTQDADGYTFLVDRIKDVILCGGYNVYPRMVEEAIYLHSAVSAVTVIGVPDDYRGQSAKAFIELRPGSSLTADELLEFLADKLSPIEMPRHIAFRDQLPRTPVGKLSKKELVAEELSRHTPPHGSAS